MALARENFPRSVANPAFDSDRQCYNSPSPYLPLSGMTCMTKHSFSQAALTRLTIVIPIVLCALTVTAQSGRRAPHPAPAATPTPEATPAPKLEPVKKSSLTLL